MVQSKFGVTTPFYPEKKKWNPTWNTTNRGAGAKEGLEKKMGYWADKDKKYEYGVSIGAAAGLAMQRLSGKTVFSPEEFEELTYKLYDLMLTMKASQKFSIRFSRYWEELQTKNEVRQEMKENNEQFEYMENGEAPKEV